MKRVFISFPYTGATKEETNKRVGIAKLYSMDLVTEGKAPFAPAIMGDAMIAELKQAMSTSMSIFAPVDASFNAWELFCYSYLDICNEMHVLMLPGWENSVGVRAEITRAERHDIEIKYIEL